MLMVVGGVLAGVIGLMILIAMLFRVVVPTNEVHIVQSATRTVSYGADQTMGKGNVYYRWPSWVPRIGLQTKELLTSVFNVNLDGYAAYDKGRVPFMIDVTAFFRITNSSMAAQRVHSTEELQEQLKSILQGAVRSILAKTEIEQILEERSHFGEMFTQAVDPQLKEWGVGSVKTIELMDIRDGEESQVIANIMAKKQSLIEKESRQAVAGNKRDAEVAEIEAEREVGVQQQVAVQAVGIRQAEAKREVGIADQQATQAITTEARETAVRDMAVKEVQVVRAAEIKKASEIVLAEQQKQVAIVVAEGVLEQRKREAEATEINGKAEGAAQTAILRAPVDTQILLATEIGQNPGYQQYLVSIKQVEANQVVGVEQAKALAEADIKVIANTGSPVDGISSVRDLFSAKGGTALGAMVEAIVQTPTGQHIVDSLTGGNGLA